MRLRKILSLVLILLLLTSVTVPAASAGQFLPVLPPALAASAPVWTELAYWGFTTVMAGATALGIALQLGKTWDGNMNSWDQLMKDTGKELDNLFDLKHPKKHEKKDWVGITDDKAQATMKAMYECCYSGAPDGKKRDNKWYFEARRHDGEIEINMAKRLDEDEAIREMGRGKDIMTVSQGHAARLVGRFEDLPSKDIMDLEFEGDVHDPGIGLFKHFHYTAKNMRLHCWAWSEDWLF